MGDKILALVVGVVVIVSLCALSGVAGEALQIHNEDERIALETENLTAQAENTEAQAQLTNAQTSQQALMALTAVAASILTQLQEIQELNRLERLQLEQMREETFRLQIEESRGETRTQQTWALVALVMVVAIAAIIIIDRRRTPQVIYLQSPPQRPAIEDKRRDIVPSHRGWVPWRIEHQEPETVDVEYVYRDVS